MSLTGWPLLILLTAAVLAAVTGTIAGWRRLGRPGPLFTIARLGAFAGTQALVIGLVLVLVNRNFGFYATWGELAGAAGEDGGRIVTSAKGSPTAVSQLIRRDPDPSFGHVPEKDGRLDTVDIRGVRSGLHARAYVYLPPQYFQPGGKERRFPVAVGLSGYPGAVRNLVDRVKVPQTALDEMNAGRVQPTVYVLLRPTIGQGRDTECMDVLSGPQTATFLAQDLPEAVRGTYPVAADRSGWGVFGLSTGGYCSLKLAMRASNVYSAAASMSGYYNAVKDVTTGDLYGGSDAVRNENDLFWRLRNLPAPPVSALVTTSEQGERNEAGTKRFLSLVKPPMQADALTLPVGGHNFETWNRVLPKVLQWMSSRLKTGKP
ncbi:alpha/beta hydrolase [Actinomadura oligospora]|uniref:alpha/beta hydrolase n=1 Tax=Actinomadura oligospora TaxID=111804 RepID=UPI00047C087F|nr:alpha/beta hydrolase-fold protein [Actinomadura oligospora]